MAHIMSIDEYSSDKFHRELNESYSESFIKKLVRRIVRSKTNNESFSFYGHNVDIQSNTSDYAAVYIDNRIDFSIDYDTLELHFESTGDLEDNEVDAIVSAFHSELDSRFQTVSVSFDTNNDSYMGDDTYKLTEEDMEMLKKWGYRDDDIESIQQCFDDDGFDMRDRFNRKIDAETAINMLGQEEFLSGIGRSCFHWSAARGSGQKTVEFDTSEWHKN